MVTELPRRTSFSGPALVRLLSRLAQIEVMEPRQTPAARLDDWLGWTESIVLSKVLNAALPSPAGRSAGGADAEGTGVGANAAGAVAARNGSGDTARGDSNVDREPGAVEGAGADVVDILELARAEYAQVRAALEQAIGAAVAPPAPVPHLQRRQIRGAPKAAGDVDFPSYRRRYSVLQQKMESSIAALRGRLRALLASQSPELARLAAVDAAMEQALVEHELRLLAGIPGLLEEHFGRLLREGQCMAMMPAAARVGAGQHGASGSAGAEASSEALSVAREHPQLDLPQQGAAPLQSNASRRIKIPAAATPEPGPWLDAFRQDMAGVLRAELDLRLQPVEGLMAALRSE